MLIRSDEVVLFLILMLIIFVGPVVFYKVFKHLID